MFDPVTWETRTLMPDGLELLGLIVSMIAQGERDRGRLIEQLLGEIAPDAASSPLPAGIDVRRNLCSLVDLALHLDR